MGWGSEARVSPFKFHNFFTGLLLSNLFFLKKKVAIKFNILLKRFF